MAIYHTTSISIKMKEPVILGLLLLSTCCTCAPSWLSFPTIEVNGGFDENAIDKASGLVVMQSGPVSLTAGRDSNGKMGVGGGVYETGQLSLGNFGKLSIKATSSLDGMYSALMNTEVFTGPRTFNPMTLSLNRNPNGVEYSATSELGYVGGTYISSTQSNVIPKFEVHLNTNGWITAVAQGQIKDRSVQMNSYNTGFNLGLLSGSMNMDGDRNVMDYEIGASIGLVHGTVKINRLRNNERSYKAGVSLGVVNFDTQINADNTRSYNSELDTGILRFSYNVDEKNTNWKGSIDLANLGVDYEKTKDGLSIAGGRIQLGSSVINIHRDSNGHFTVKFDDGSIVE